MASTEKTLSEVIEILRLRGYTEDFNLLEENISYKTGGEKVNLSDIVGKNGQIDHLISE
ncbi:hypothetical protein [Chryseobacterium gleum]|uniref:hypothetical protein n=1 Tax=Chryseobacterium gleum TaxID=250 RepID=UPI00241D9384|nr:hypothetical protein [Chryseobacterium gleum]